MAAACWLGAVQAQASPSFEIIRTLIDDGYDDQARAYGRQLSRDDDENELNLIFVEALILKRDGDNAGAVALLRRVLDADPSFARVRQELAHTLFLMGDLDASRHHFQFLSRTVDAAGQTALYDSYLLAIRSRRPWTLEGSIGLAPSTNINDGTMSNLVYVGGIPFRAGNVASSGIGVTYSAAGTYRLDLTGSHALTIGGFAAGASYRNSDFDRLSAENFGELSVRHEGWRFGAGLAAGRILSGWKGHRWSAGPHISVRREMGRAGVFAARLGWRHLDYDKVDAFDGSATDLSLYYRFAATPAVFLGAGLNANLVRTRLDFHDHVALRPQLWVDWVASPALTLHANAAFEHRSYGGDFPFTGAPRRDRRYDVGLAATLPKLAWNDFVPRIGYNFHETRSNVELYDRRSHSLGISITRKY